MDRKKKRVLVSQWAFFLFLAVGPEIFLLSVRAQPAGDPQSGRAIYLRNCARCHGRQGEGMGPEGALPNFTDPNYMKGWEDQTLFEKITKGGKGTGMPGFERMLSEQDRWNVVAYLKTLPASR